MAETRQQAHDPYQAFRVPGVARLMLGGVFINIGVAAQSVAIGWEMYQRTNSAMALGLVGLAQAVPMLLFTLPAGYLADVFDRRRMMLGLGGTTLTSLALGALSISHGSIPAMYTLLFFDAAFQRLAGPAGTSILPLLVPADTLENAIKWRTSLFHIASVIGPALGGVIVALYLPAAYLFSAATTLIYMVLLSALRVPEGTKAVRGQMLRQLAEGIGFVWRQKVILGAISLDLFAVLLGGATYLLPVFARDILTERPLGMSPEQSLGWLRAAPALGAFVMAVIMTHRPPLSRAGRDMLLAVAGFGVATIVFGVSRSFWLSLAMLFLTGFLDNVSVVVRHTLVQLRTPNEMRGRVSAVNSIFIGSSNELGGFESGAVARFLGPVFSVISGGIGTLLVVGVWAKLFPGLREFGRLSGSGDEPDASGPS
jgi:MFS family permease